MRRHAISASQFSWRLVLATGCCALLVAASRAAPEGGAENQAAPTASPAEEAAPAQVGIPTEAVEFFETRIRPVLVEHCYECHSADAKVLQANLRLDTAAGVRAGGDSGPAILPHKPEESPLLAALRYESYEMPPSGKLPDHVIADFARWIALGAPDPRTDAVAGVSDPGRSADPAQHWAFNKPQRAAPPPVKHESDARSELDRFIVARLEAAGLTPSAPAAPRALLRRLYYDLIGLPPTDEELAAFAADPSDAAYDAIVDRLLAASSFGERWARHWLDIARYADTTGYLFEQDRNYKHAYTYRDWVIASFNADRPYDQFVIAQLAPEQLENTDCAPAIGFLTLGRRFLNNKPDIINDRIDVVTRGLMGLTVACARCHDHKYDPISTADYYALYGVFANSQETPRDDGPMALMDVEQPADQAVFIRGNPHNRGPVVPRRFLTCLSVGAMANAGQDGAEPPPFQHGSGRREMAEAIASRENPLTARVWVNRVWGHLFGEGIVATPSDFGTRGLPPTHPELLDYLACELMEDGWSTKRLIRRIVLSSTYRQSSDERAECAAVDPENRLLWRSNRRRLDLEAMRDSLLAAAGRLDRSAGGPSVSLTDAPFTTRRAVYGFIERQNLPAFFRTFDFSNPNTHTPERPATTAPQQALFLMNSPFILEQAMHLAKRSSPEGAAPAGPADYVRRVDQLYRAALGREPTVEELAEALEFIEVGDPPELARVVNQSAWHFGWGTFDEAAGSIQFHPLPHFTGGAWQGGAKLPDPTLGWATLNAEGGHVGDPEHPVIRRWVAPAAGTLHIEGVLSHVANVGDGVRGRIVVRRAGLVGTWQAFHSQASTAPPQLTVEPGDTVDFITDCRTTIEHDFFNWDVTLRLTSADTGAVQMWDSVSGFHGPLLPPLTRWEQLAQVLLMSNEFAFID